MSGYKNAPKNNMNRLGGTHDLFIYFKKLVGEFFFLRECSGELGRALLLFIHTLV